MGLIEVYYEYVEETRDARTLTWPLLSVTALVIILFNYFYFIFGCGVRYMKNREPYDLKNIIRLYDIFQIFANGFLVYHWLQNNFYEYISCPAPLHMSEFHKLQIANLIWWTYMLKVVDLIETFFFVLRKKNRQISFLHVHHHAATVFMAWLSIRYYPRGIACLVYVLNCSVHVIMYTYYFLSSMNSTIQRMVNPYKSILTSIQIVQLIVIVTYILKFLIGDCKEPKLLLVVGLVNVAINLYFFYDFYKKNYSKSKRKSVQLTQ